MGIDADFHEMFHVAEAAPNQKKSKSGAQERVRVRQMARGRGLRLEQLQMQPPIGIGRPLHEIIILPPRKPPPVPAVPAAPAKPLTDSLTTPSAAPYIELNSNPSNFAVFAAVRQRVLEAKLRQATVLYNQTVQGLAVDDAAEVDDDERNKNSVALKVSDSDAVAVT